MGKWGKTVLPSERRLQIVDEIHGSGVVRAEHLAERFGVSLETVRRDLRDLERQGLLQRVYGGATSSDFRAAEENFEQRCLLHQDRKREIAAAAVALVEPDETIFIDVGTTCLEFARSLPSDWSGRVLTNSLLVAVELAARPAVEVLVTGGQVRGGDMTCSGPFGAALHEFFYVARAFVGAGGVHPEAGLTDYHLGEGSLRRLWLERAVTFYVLSDSSKLGVIAPFQVAATQALTAVITDCAERGEIIEELRERGTDVIIGRPIAPEGETQPGALRYRRSKITYPSSKNKGGK